MNYKLSICHPDNDKIEKLSKIFSSQEALNYFATYPWLEQLEFLDKMNQEEVQYNPSIDFTSTSNNISLELTAETNDEILIFSLWYKRPVMTKILFGLFGEKNKMKLIEKWGFEFDSSKEYLEAFLKGNYKEVERIMNN